MPRPFVDRSHHRLRYLRRLRHIVRLASTAAWASVAGCTAAPGPPVVAVTPTSRSAMHVLPAEELRRHPDPSATLYERVRATRTGFFMIRGEEPVVFVDGRYAGPLSALQVIPVHAVREIRLVRGAEVPLLYGPRHVHAAVLDVILRP